MSNYPERLDEQHDRFALDFQSGVIRLAESGSEDRLDQGTLAVVSAAAAALTWELLARLVPDFLSEVAPTMDPDEEIMMASHTLRHGPMRLTD
jgi:hypothetical protein